jgi:hypothetical protein
MSCAGWSQSVCQQVVPGWAFSQARARRKSGSLYGRGWPLERAGIGHLVEPRIVRTSRHLWPVNERWKLKLVTQAVRVKHPPAVCSRVARRIECDHDGPRARRSTRSSRGTSTRRQRVRLHGVDVSRVGGCLRVGAWWLGLAARRWCSLGCPTTPLDHTARRVLSKPRLASEPERLQPRLTEVAHRAPPCGFRAAAIVGQRVRSLGSLCRTP